MQAVSNLPISAWLATVFPRGSQKTPRLHDNRANPVSRDPGIAMPGSRLTGLRFFHVIAFAGPAWFTKPMRVQNQARFGFPRIIASAINRAGSPHVIPA